MISSNIRRRSPILFAALLLSGIALHAQTTGSRLLTYSDADGRIKKVRTITHWEIKRQQILDRMQLAMGPLPGRNQAGPLQVNIKDSLQQRNHIRYEITFMAAENEPVPAFLFVPLRKENMPPCWHCMEPARSGKVHHERKRRQGKQGPMRKSWQTGDMS